MDYNLFQGTKYVEGVNGKRGEWREGEKERRREGEKGRRGEGEKGVVTYRDIIELRFCTLKSGILIVVLILVTRVLKQVCDEEDKK